MLRLVLLLALTIGEFSGFEATAFRPSLHPPFGGDTIVSAAIGAPAVEPPPGSPRRRRQGDAETL